MKKDKKTTFGKIKTIVNKFPKTINEAIQFGEQDSNMDNYDDDIFDEPDNEVPEQQSTGLDVDKFVDDIRKQSLRGMAQLADNPDDEKYQLLKKIWQICDKKPEQQVNRQNGMVDNRNY